MKIVAEAPAKLVLFGEYVVLEGAPAIVAAVDRCATVTVEAQDATSVDSDLGPEAGAAWFDAWREAASNRELPGLHVELRTAPLFSNGNAAKLGLGSSAALTVAMGAALRTALGDAAVDDRAFEEDLAIHHRLQGGSGSGIDVAASFHGGVLAWWAGGRVEKLQAPPGLHFACVWTGEPASTAEMLDRVRAFERKRPAEYAGCMERMADVARRALEAFRADRGDAIVPLATEYHRAMADLGARASAPIVSDAHRELAEIATTEDVAYKPSGAGGGDVGLLLSTSASGLERARERCSAAGYRIVDVRIHAQGVAVTNS